MSKITQTILPTQLLYLWIGFPAQKIIVPQVKQPDPKIAKLFYQIIPDHSCRLVINPSHQREKISLY